MKIYKEEKVEKTLIVELENQKGNIEYYDIDGKKFFRFRIYARTRPHEQQDAPYEDGWSKEELLDLKDAIDAIIKETGGQIG